MSNQPYGPHEGRDPHQQRPGWPGQQPYEEDPHQQTQQWEGQTWETQGHPLPQAASAEETAYLPPVQPAPAEPAHGMQHGMQHGTRHGYGTTGQPLPPDGQSAGWDQEGQGYGGPPVSGWNQGAQEHGRPAPGRDQRSQTYGSPAPAWDQGAQGHGAQGGGAQSPAPDQAALGYGPQTSGQDQRSQAYGSPAPAWGQGVRRDGDSQAPAWDHAGQGPVPGAGPAYGGFAAAPAPGSAPASGPAPGGFAGGVPGGPGAAPAAAVAAATTGGDQAAASAPAYGPPTVTGNPRVTDAQRARAEGRSPIIEPGGRPAALTAVLGLLLAGTAAIGQYALVVPLVILQAVTAAGWFRLNGMWPARQGIALAFAGALTADVALLAAGRDNAPAAILGTLGVWVLLALVLQLRSHADPDERMYGLMASVASAALAIVATGHLAATEDAVTVGAVAVAVAVLARALPLPTPASVLVALLAAAGAGLAAGGLTDLGTDGALLGVAAGVAALIGHRVASYDYPSRFVHLTAGVALPLAAAAPAIYLVGKALG